MYSLFNDIESNIKTIHENGMDHLMKMWGFQIEVFEPKNDSVSDVYGSSSGTVRYESSGKVTGIVTGDGFYASDRVSSGIIDEGWLFVMKGDVGLVRPGCRISVKGGDGLSRSFQVLEEQDLGTTMAVISRFRISSVG